MPSSSYACKRKIENYRPPPSSLLLAEISSFSVHYGYAAAAAAAVMKEQQKQPQFITKIASVDVFKMKKEEKEEKNK